MRNIRDAPSRRDNSRNGRRNADGHPYHKGGT